MEVEKKVCPDCNGGGVYQEYDEYDRYTVHSCPTCDGSGEIARQYATSEEVQRAIDLLKEIQHDKYVIQNHTENDVKNYELVSFAITALQAYQPTISKTETIGCDDLYSQCDECGQIYLENRGYDYCPYCGRRLED